MKDQDIKKLAEEISFRLLATKAHVDFEWLVETLKQFYEKETRSSS